MAQLGFSYSMARENDRNKYAWQLEYYYFHIPCDENLSG